MASSRSLRRASRRTSPAEATLKHSTNPQSATNVQKEKISAADVWTEPPLRAPAPSFEDHKGLERHGVLEHMAPLGSLPNQRVKLRGKQPESARRPFQPKGGESATTGKELVEEAIPYRSRSESSKVESRPTKIGTSLEEDDDEDYTPESTTKSAATKPVAKSLPLRSSIPRTPTPRPNPAQERLRQVVESAVERSRELGNEILGLSIRKLFDESLRNRTLADLLEAVLSQRPTQRQAADFQAYIKVARKQIKHETRSPAIGVPIVDSPSKSHSKSPSKSVRPAATDQSGSSKVSHHNHTPTQPPPTHQHQPREQTMGTNGASQEPPAKRVKRTKSVSSTSSLSSLDSSDPAMELEDASTAQNQPPDKPTSTSKAPASTGPKLHTFSTVNYAGHATNKRPLVSTTPNVDDATDQAAKRRKLQRTFNDYKVSDSNIRGITTPRDPAPIPPPILVAPTSLSTLKQHSKLRNGDSRSNPAGDHENLRSPASSTHGEFLVPPPPGAQRVSRGATPNQPGRATKPMRRAARVKNSPMKKKCGVIAGIAHNGGGRDSPVGYGHLDENGDNDNVDYCTACSGNGQLLCCDGCTRSFHFTCLDPPMNPLQPPEGEWYCYICESKRDPQPKPPRGLFSDLLAVLEKKNPTAFNLPLEIRDYFEGVKTGEEGEYEEASTQKSRTRAGYDEAPDNFKLKDGKGNPVLCFKCGKSSLGHREIIACDFCCLRWHLDCLDPPLANPPARGDSYKSKLSWMCPNHVDSELLALASAQTASKAGCGRTHKVRRPKNTRIVDTALRRGFVNNGNIEIENEPTDDEEEFEKEEFGVTYRVPEKGLKLDFIDRIKKSHYEAALQQQMTVRAREERKMRLVAAAKVQKEAFAKRPLAERQAAYHLAALAQANPDSGLDSNQVENLIGTLIAEAPAEVLALPNAGSSIPPTPPASDLQDLGPANEKAALLRFLDLAKQRLAQL